MEPPKRIVSILKNTDNPPRFYTGITADLRERLEAHNAGRCSHTANHRGVGGGCHRKVRR